MGFISFHSYSKEIRFCWLPGIEENIKSTFIICDDIDKMCLNSKSNISVVGSRCHFVHAWPQCDPSALSHAPTVYTLLLPTD